MLTRNSAPGPGTGCLSGGDNMATFEGYIIKFKEEVFPVELIAPSSYDITPEIRKIIHDWPDNNGTMHYDIYRAKKVDVQFSTKMSLHQKDVEKIQKVLKAGLISEHEGRYDITVWNPHSSTYKHIEAKADDIKYPMRKVDPIHNDIIYDSIKFRFREY